MADEQWQHLEVKDPVEHRTARQLNDAWASLPHAAQRGLSISSVPSAITRRCSLQLTALAATCATMSNRARADVQRCGHTNSTTSAAGEDRRPRMINATVDVGVA